MGSFVSVIETVSKEVGAACQVPSSSGRFERPAYTVSNISKAQKVLGWTPVASTLTNIVGFVISSCKAKPRP
jgi:UDP-glucose 4-epimerase